MGIQFDRLDGFTALQNAELQFGGRTDSPPLNEYTLAELATIENRLRTLADHVAIELRTRRNPAAFYANHIPTPT